uniref:AlNc14C84G5421 protein n=1 Tax=Albugo laibachii Nc14 TaxID=890382 RepID=F0WFN7_9STRA|nr:AlNc14C84G5421 [Albugo laibachii Nc14]|eukprot:CCA20019.1 AlNc14C84G5421 [Albugo laibachii Nc14]
MRYEHFYEGFKPSNSQMWRGTMSLWRSIWRLVVLMMTHRVFTMLSEPDEAIQARFRTTVGKRTQKGGRKLFFRTSTIRYEVNDHKAIYALALLLQETDVMGCGVVLLLGMVNVAESSNISITAATREVAPRRLQSVVPGSLMHDALQLYVAAIKPGQQYMRRCAIVQYHEPLATLDAYYLRNCDYQLMETRL